MQLMSRANKAQKSTYCDPRALTVAKTDRVPSPCHTSSQISKPPTKLLLLHPFNDLFSTTTWYQKGKTSLYLNEASDDGVLQWQWHQLDHVQTICELCQRDIITLSVARLCVCVCQSQVGVLLKRINRSRKQPGKSSFLLLKMLVKFERNHSQRRR